MLLSAEKGSYNIGTIMSVFGSNRVYNIINPATNQFSGVADHYGSRPNKDARDGYGVGTRNNVLHNTAAPVAASDYYL